MVFVGSRIDLKKVSTDFKDVWVSFVREYNRTFPLFKRNYSVPELKPKLKELNGKITILKNEVNKKLKSVVGEQKKGAFISLSNSLKSLGEEFTSLSESLKFGTIGLEQIASDLAMILHQIKEVKALISVVAHFPSNPARRKLLRAAVGVTAGLVVGMISTKGLSSVTNNSLAFLARKLPLKKKDGLAVLISFKTHSWWDTTLKPPGKLFIPTYVHRLELAFGQKANIVHKGATTKDLYDVLMDDSIQNVVIYGHGSWSSWLATDRDISSQELWGPEGRYRKYTVGSKRKSGILLRHTCGHGQEVESFPILALTTKEVTKFKQLEKKINGLLPENCSLTVWGKEFYFPHDPEYWKKYWEKEGLYIYDQYGLTLNVTNAEDKKKKGWFWYFHATHSGKIEQSKRRNKLLKELLKDNSDALTLLEESMDLIKQKARQRPEIMLEKFPLFGTPIFKRKNILGWGRIATPFEFLFDVFGKENEYRDQLLKEAAKEKKSNTLISGVTKNGN
jgi:hypothetical protein